MDCCLTLSFQLSSLIFPSYWVLYRVSVIKPRRRSNTTLSLLFIPQSAGRNGCRLGVPSVHIPEDWEYSCHLADGSDLVADDLLAGWSRGTWGGQRSDGVKETAVFLCITCHEVGWSGLYWIFFLTSKGLQSSFVLKCILMVYTHHNMLLPYTTHTHTPTLSPNGFFLFPVLAAEMDRIFFFLDWKIMFKWIVFLKTPVWRSLEGCSGKWMIMENGNGAVEEVAERRHHYYFQDVSPGTDPREEMCLF